MASQIARYGIPLGASASFIFHGTTVHAAAEDDCNRPNPAEVYKERIRAASTCIPIKQRECKDTELEKFVMVARQELGPYSDTIMSYTNKGIQQMNLFYEKLLDNLCYLRTGAPQEMKVGTIVAGGLTGMLLGVRGGYFRKLMFGSLGAAGGAYLAYPYETVKYTKKYTAVAYNFIAGARK